MSRNAPEFPALEADGLPTFFLNIEPNFIQLM
jgi:hypothetical protein